MNPAYPYKQAGNKIYLQAGMLEEEGERDLTGQMQVGEVVGDVAGASSSEGGASPLLLLGPSPWLVRRVGEGGRRAMATAASVT